MGEHKKDVSFISMKLGDLVGPRFSSSFSRLMQSKVPISTAFRLRTMSRIIQAEIDKYNEVRGQLIKELSEKDENGKPVEKMEGGHPTISVSDANTATFQTKIQELHAVTVDLATLTPADLGDASLTPADITVLEFIVEG